MESSQEIPNGRELGDIVTLVAETMFERHLVAYDDASAPPAAEAAIAGVQLSLQGDKCYYLRGCWHTSGKPSARAEPNRAELGEMLNIVAGQIKSQFMLAWEIGLPQQWAAMAPTVSHPRRGTWLAAREGGASLWVELTAEDELSKERRP